MALSSKGHSWDCGVDCAEGYAFNVHLMYRSKMSIGSSTSSIDCNSISYSFRIASFNVLVSSKVIGFPEEQGLRTAASCFADRPPGREQIFSFAFSSKVKSIKSSDKAILCKVLATYDPVSICTNAKRKDKGG